MKLGHTVGRRMKLGHTLGATHEAWRYAGGGRMRLGGTFLGGACEMRGEATREAWPYETVLPFIAIDIAASITRSA